MIGSFATLEVFPVMTMPINILGVPLMDKDHAHLDAMLLRASQAGEAALPELLMEIEAETRAHFSREEELMRSARVPVLHCHIGQHAHLLSQFDQGREAAARGDTARLRRFLCADLPELFRDHVGTVDRVTAGFLQDSVEA
jgi:hemerythrin